MKLENQLVSKKLSIKLDELGFKTESLYWHKIPNKKCRNGSVASIVEYPEESKWFDYYRAYSVSEIGEMLPLKIDDEDLTIWREKGFESWDVAYSTLARKEEVWEQSKNLVDAMAKMAIYLLENNLIKL